MKKRFMTQMKWLMLFSLLTSSLYAGDSINSITGPTTITKGQTVTLTVDYEANEERTLAVYFQSLNPKKMQFYKRITVQAGDELEEISFTVPEDISTAGTFRYKAYIAPKGGKWSSNLGYASQEGVTAVDVSLNDSIKSIIGPNTITAGEIVTLSVDYEASEERTLAVYFQSLNPKKMQFYKRITVQAGDAVEEVTFTVPDDIPLDGTFRYKTYIAPLGGKYSSNLGASSQEGVVTINNNGLELIDGGGNENGLLDASKWIKIIDQNKPWDLSVGDCLTNEKCIHVNPYAENGGMYQVISTEEGKTYILEAKVLGSNHYTDVNNYTLASSYMTVESSTPTPTSTPEYQTEKVKSNTPQIVKITFTATSQTTYISLRGDTEYKYPTALSISVKRFGTGGGNDTPNLGVMRMKEYDGSITDVPLSDFYKGDTVSSQGFTHPGIAITSHRVSDTLSNKNVYPYNKSIVYAQKEYRHSFDNAIEQLDKIKAEISNGFLDCASNKDQCIDISYIAMTAEHLIKLNLVNEGEPDALKKAMYLIGEFWEIAQKMGGNQNTYLYLGWPMINIARSMESLNTVCNFTVNKNTNMFTHNGVNYTHNYVDFNDLKTDVMSVLNRDLFNPKNQYYIGGNWETTTMTAIKMMGVVFDDRELYTRYDSRLEMLWEWYIYLNEDGDYPKHPIEKLGWDRGIEEFLGGETFNRYYDFCVGSEGEVYRREFSTVDIDNLLEGNITLGAAWYPGREASAYHVDGIVMEQLRDFGHAWMGAEPLHMLLKMMMIQNDVIPKHVIKRAIRSGEILAKTRLLDVDDRPFRPFGDNMTKNNTYHNIVLGKHSYAYGFTIYDIAKELEGKIDMPINKNILKRQIDEYIFPSYDSSNSNMSHTQTASECLLGMSKE